MTAMILKQEAALQRRRRRLLAAVTVSVTMMPMMMVMDRGGDRGGRGGVRPVQQQPTMMEMTRYRRQDTHQCSDYQHECRRDNVAARTHCKETRIVE